MPTPQNAVDTTRPDAGAALRRALDRLASGDAAAAVRAASDACHAAPGDARAHYAYGQAWLALGAFAPAGQAFAGALRLRPNWADAWVNLGVARYRAGDPRQAIVAMRHALRHAPGHAAALANLGAFLRITGNAEESESVLRDCLAHDPGNAGARLNLAADLLQQERAAEALALLQTRPPAAAGSPADGAAGLHWHLHRSLALLQLGQAGAARLELAALDALGPLPPALAPLRRWRSVLLAQAEGDAARARHEAAAMAAALDAMGPQAVPEHRIMGQYDLAKFWSGQREPRRAFAHWQAGHALLRAAEPFDRSRHAALIDASIAAFDAPRFAGPRARNADPAPVFIVGMPRSGTTLCEQILAAHPDAHGAGERAALGALFRRLGGGGADGPARIAALDAAALDAAAADYLAGLHALAPDRARIVDKMPGNSFYLGLAGLLLPGARVIHCVRDPRDIGLSIFTFRFYGHHAYAHDLGDLGWAIAQHDRLMAHWTAAFPSPVLRVGLADWVGDFDATLARVLDHVGLPHDPACARFHERRTQVRTVSYAQVRQPVNAGGLGRWRAFADELAPLVAELESGGALRGWT